MLAILLFIPGEYAGACFLGFAIGESLGASALRIAGGIFTKIADIGSDLMKVVFKIKEDDARNPGVIADCTGDNAGDSVGPTADGFETYGVTGVALIMFIMLAVKDPATQVQLLVWIFMIRVVMVLASAGSYLVNNAVATGKYATVEKMNFETPLTSLVWLTSIVSVVLTYVLSYLLIPSLGGNTDLWWQLSTVITCGTLAGAIIPEFVKVFTSTHSSHVKEVVTSSREGGASLNILSGLVAGNFSAYWLGLTIMGLMTISYIVSSWDLSSAMVAGSPLMVAPAIFAFGLVAFGFLGMGPVTIAVDSYRSGDRQRAVGLRTVADRRDPRHRAGDPEAVWLRGQLQGGERAARRERRRRQHVQGDRQAGADRHRRGRRDDDDLRDHHGADPRPRGSGGDRDALDPAPALPARADHRRRGDLLVHRRLDAGGDRRCDRAVEFIKANIKLDGSTKASVEDSKKVVEICTIYAQKGMWNIFLGVFFSTLAFAFVEPFFFIGYFNRSRCSGSTRRSSWPTPAAHGTTPRRSSKPS